MRGSLTVSFPRISRLRARATSGVCRQLPQSGHWGHAQGVGNPPRIVLPLDPGRAHHIEALEMTKQRLEKLIEATAPNGFRVRVFKDATADKLVTFGGDEVKVSALESDKPKSVMQAMSDMFVAFKNLNDCAKEMGMTGQDRANLAVDLLSILKKGPAK
jgi:hypothetical protein